MMKRGVCLLLALLAVLTLAAPAFASEADVVASGSCGDEGSDIGWSLTADGVLTISGKGRIMNYPHPQHAGGAIPWSAVAPWLYYDLELSGGSAPLCPIKKIVIGKGVTAIGEMAFTYCHASSVELPEGLREIGDFAFGDAGLTSLTLPSTIERIGLRAFAGCSIDTLVIPAGVSTIDSSAFTNGGASATRGGQISIVTHQIDTVKILSRDCDIMDSGGENGATYYEDNTFTIGDPGYTVITGYPGSTAEAFAQKWGYMFKAIDGVDPDGLPAPELKDVRRTDGGAQVMWEPVVGAAQYRVFYRTGSGGWKKAGDTADVTYTWAEADPGTIYSFTVRCLSADGKKYVSSYDREGKPLAISGGPSVAAALAENGVRLSWDKVPGAGAYRVFYRTSEDGKWKKLADTTETGYTCERAKLAGGTYWFTVRCVQALDSKTYTSGYDAVGVGVQV